MTMKVISNELMDESTNQLQLQLSLELWVASHIFTIYVSAPTRTAVQIRRYN
jgi:hypothetical protein